MGKDSSKSNYIQVIGCQAVEFSPPTKQYRTEQSRPRGILWPIGQTIPGYTLHGGGLIWPATPRTSINQLHIGAHGEAACHALVTHSTVNVVPADELGL